MSCEKYFIDKVREKGLRMTPQREIILGVIHLLDDYATVDDIYEQVKKRSSVVNRSTVYRTMEVLEGMSLVNVVEKAGGIRHYALQDVHSTHYHAVCKKCGAVVSIEPESLLTLDTYLQAKYKFKMEIQQLSIPGLCEQCAMMLESSEKTADPQR